MLLPTLTDTPEGEPGSSGVGTPATPISLNETPSSASSVSEEEYFSTMKASLKTPNYTGSLDEKNISRTHEVRHI